jgi:two-component system chemotaxis response regulator CheB
MPVKKKIKILIVNDSAVSRYLVTRYLLIDLLSEAKDIEIVDTVQDPKIAIEKISVLGPDVVILDIMPIMEGLSFLKKLKKTCSVPVVMLSTLTPYESVAAVKAWDLTSVEFVFRNAAHSRNSALDISDEIIRKVRLAAGTVKGSESDAWYSDVSGFPSSVEKKGRAQEKIIAIGAAAGSTQAIRKILLELPSSVPGIVITQHIHSHGVPALAEHLNTYSQLSVKEARTGDKIQSGSAYLSPGDRHLTVSKKDSQYCISLEKSVQMPHTRPSIDKFFTSVAAHAGENAIGILLGGAENDGAMGLLKMKKAGALTITLGEEDSMDFGLPNLAINLDAAVMIAQLHEIPGLILQNIST